MANYCMNRLTVRGNLKELNQFKAKVWKSKDEPLCFEGTVPMPKALEGTESPSNLSKIKQLGLKMKYGHSDWRSWQLDNWGCKWGPYETSISGPTESTYKNGNGKLTYLYDTPWAPPTNWILNTSKLFPNLKFENFCDEPGVGFKGTETIIDGELITSTINN